MSDLSWLHIISGEKDHKNARLSDVRVRESIGFGGQKEGQNEGNMGRVRLICATGVISDTTKRQWPYRLAAIDCTFPLIGMSSEEKITSTRKTKSSFSIFGDSFQSEAVEGQTYGCNVLHATIHSQCRRSRRSKGSIQKSEHIVCPLFKVAWMTTALPLRIGMGGICTAGLLKLRFVYLFTF